MLLKQEIVYSEMMITSALDLADKSKLTLDHFK